ncbi:ArnT family glycosyltransferase [Acetivibrio cellulolyticus]|uniref:ArnT family glycosyltransferase n=1 Tax=Acetivibrio cellulolyticus TaxID=35830 RepID=UPI0013C3468A|nr:glycosyltransferase family 39 protein [Acetivibrio cellulolyticus]
MNTLYAYLTMPLIKIFGLNETTAILGNLIFCILSLVIIFFTVKRLKNIDMALLATFIMAISPWHIMIARWGLLENIFPAIVLIGVFFYSLYLKKPKYIIPFAAVMSLSLYAYGPAYFVIPVLLLILAIYEAYFAKSKIQWFKNYLKAFVCFVIIAIPIVIFVYINIISPSSQTVKLGPITVPKLVEAGYRYNQVVFLGGGKSNLWNTLKENFAVFYDTVFRQTGYIYNVIDKYGTIYRISNFFFLIGFLASILGTLKSFKEKKIQLDFVFLVWFILSCILGIVNNTNTNRINIIFIPMMYLAAYGIYVFAILASLLVKFVVKSISANAQKHAFKLAKLIVLTIIAVLYLTNFSAFAKYYFTEYPDQINQIFHESFDDALQYVVDNNKDTRDVYVTDFNGAFTLVLFYTKYDPNEFYSTVNYTNPYTEFRPVSSFGNYKFITIDKSIEAADNSYYIVENFQINNLTGVKSPKNVKQFKRFTVLEY